LIERSINLIERSINLKERSINLKDLTSIVDIKTIVLNHPLKL
jgi:hypothetical protein